MMMQISRAPSSASSGKFFLRRSRVMYAWASARGLREDEVRRGPSGGVVDKSKIFLRDGRSRKNAIGGVGARGDAGENAEGRAEWDRDRGRARTLTCRGCQS